MFPCYRSLRIIPPEVPVFTTLLIPVKAGDPLPEVTPCGKNLYRITAGDQQHIINIAKLDSNIK